MPSNLILRALNPQTEQSLFREAFDWRTKRKSHLQPDRMSFDDFAADNPNQIVLGLFNDELLAVYLFSQISPTQFEAHFTSNRKAKRGDVLAGARQLVRWFQESGLEIVAHVIARNRPLCRFLEEAGLVRQPDTRNLFTSVCRGDTVSATSQLWLEYRSGMVPPVESERQQAEISGHVSNERVVRL